MSTVEEIKSAISALSREDYVRLREWFSSKDREQRDKEIEGGPGIFGTLKEIGIRRGNPSFLRFKN